MDNPKAFPIIISKEMNPNTNEIFCHGNEGMDLRDYFAAKAMQGLLAGIEDADLQVHDLDLLASEAYQTADAMLKAREVQSE